MSLLFSSMWLIAKSVVTNCTEPASCDVTLPSVAANDGGVKIALQILFGIIGALAVFFVVYGGFKFVTSQGDPQAVGKARATVLYAVIGLVIAISAEIIVSFVIGSL